MAKIPVKINNPNIAGDLVLNTDTNMLEIFSDGEYITVTDQTIQTIENVIEGPQVKCTYIPRNFKTYQGIFNYQLAGDFPDRSDPNYKQSRADEILVFDRFSVAVQDMAYNIKRIFYHLWTIDIRDPLGLGNFDPNNFYINNVFGIKKTPEEYRFLLLDQHTSEGLDISLYYIRYNITTKETILYEIGNIRKYPYYPYHGIDYNPNTNSIILAEYGSQVEPIDETYDTVKVYKINISNLNNISFTTVFEKNSRAHANPEIRHFHTVFWYNYNNTDYWLLTSGDGIEETKIWISSDDGNTWNILKENDGKYLLLDFEIKDNFLYWGTDTTNPSICKMSMENFTITTLIDSIDTGGLPFYSITKTKNKNKFLLIASIGVGGETKIILFDENTSTIKILKELPFSSVLAKTKMLIDESIFSYKFVYSSDSDLVAYMYKIELFD